MQRPIGLKVMTINIQGTLLIPDTIDGDEFMGEFYDWLDEMGWEFEGYYEFEE